MPRFFFHIQNGHGPVPDETGTDLPDQSAARNLAIDSIRSMIAEDARRGVIDLSGRIDIKDKAENLLIEIRYAEAFKLRLPEP
jgi:hypothetical protein